MRPRSQGSPLGKRADAMVEYVQNPLRATPSAAQRGPPGSRWCGQSGWPHWAYRRNSRRSLRLRL